MVRISHALKNRIFFHGEAAYPEECCGLLLGVELEGIRQVHEVAELHNSQELNRERRFLITPEQYRQAEKLAREKNLELLGFYHSHPDHQASPSQFDTEHALPWFVYVIVSVMKRQSEEITAWILGERRQRFEEEKISIE